MAADDDGKSEQPTGKRLSEARDKGDISQSQEVKTAAMLLAMAVFVWLIAPLSMVRLRDYLARFLGEPHAIRVTTGEELSVVTSDLLANIGLAMVMPFAFLLLVGLTASVGQTGWVVSTEKLTPDISKLNPVAGFGRLFSVHSLVELLKSVAKLVVVGVICYLVLRPRVSELDLLPSMEMAAILTYLHQLLVRLMMVVATVMVVIAVSDWFYQRHAYMQKLKMTKQEVKEENKQSEGDPLIKSRLRGLRMARARQRMMAAVPKADVVVTNPTHFACALKYDSETMNAPTLVAKGQDLVAFRIREIAKENNVPIVENPPLARALYATVDLDREVPPDHYKAVAEVISYVMRLKGKLRR
ncbi:flagellar biosynthesis protein FlhB [Telmatospirillum siberiense]|uniref:Flagellar biosynthetic protein FlhB n=1 Tax=Telmatospirillum siberiense TaxID=382514 RepID=A0A2N3Q037_9PROT|nr:flagellar biosynthesis protein FlhB [Telmatospirillum siberiense]PKU26027.1 flagellar biosynthesis protein FlhB [Telmatospirillum siberiense]